MKKINFKTAHTFAEVVIAMIIIGIIIGVTMNITRAKLERADKYTYYAAYTTLTSLVSEILADTSTGLLPDGICSQFETRLNSLNQQVSVSGTLKEPSCTESMGTETDFSKLIPNFAARNGMRFYNLNSDVVSINQLRAAEPITNAEEEVVPVEEDTNEVNGYIIYIDIDGERGSSKLYQDIFPFYLTRSGKVIPAYPSSGSAGANSTDQMVFSVRYDTIDENSVRTEHWLAKSVSFKEAACRSGYITSEIYCKGYAVDEACTEAENGCVIVPVKPIKYWAK